MKISTPHKATFAADTIIMAVHKDAYSASELSQRNLDSVYMWMRLWRMKVNEAKYTQITYIYFLAQTAEIRQGLGRFLSCGARKQEQT